MEQNGNEYSLSIRLASDGFSLSVHDPAGEVLVRRAVSAPLFRCAKPELDELFGRSLGVDVDDYDRVSLVVETDGYELVPAALFEAASLDDYYYFRHERAGDMLVLFNRVPQWEAVNVFAIPATLHGAISDLFPDVMPQHQLSFFLSHRLRRSTPRQVAVWVRTGWVDVVVVGDGRLQLANSFCCHTVEDALYFVLSCFEQCALSVDKTDLALYQRDSSTGLRDLLARYVKHVRIVSQ